MQRRFFQVKIYIKQVTKLISCGAVLVFITLSSSFAYAQSILQVGIVYNKSQKPVARHIQNALYTFPKPHPRIHLYETQEFLAKQNEISPFDLIVTLGPHTTERILRTNPDTPVLSALIRESFFSHLVANLALDENFNPKKVSAIFLDQPILRQMRLVKHLLEKPKIEVHQDVGILLGPTQVQWQDQWHHSAEVVKVPLNMVLLNRKDNPIAALNFLLQNTKAIILLPDQNVFNRHTALGILLAAYKKQIPLIGYSRKYVRLGAIGAVYSNGKQIAHQIAQSLISIQQVPSYKLPGKQYPTTFSVAINYQVAKSLGLNIRSDIYIRNQLILDEQAKLAGRSCLAPVAESDLFKGKNK